MTADLKAVLKEAEKLITPSQAEEKKVSRIVSEIERKVNRTARRQKINAHLQAGGSAAKGTWLPGFSDIDFFLVFDYDEFSEKSAELSDYAEKILGRIFRITRLHGSRDYFSAVYKKYNVEIIPVLDISEEQQARNITDFSPLHVAWFNVHAKEKPKLRTEVRLAKKFFMVAGVYGAESYIRGFSGHVVEILTVNYGSFAHLVNAILKWKFQEVIDVKKHYRNAKEVFANLNKSKLESAIILVDPIEKDRNAAAALDKEKFMLAKEACHKFLDNPHTGFFKGKKFSIEGLKKKKADLKLIIVNAKAKKGKPDVIGAKLRKKFELICKEFSENDFITQDSGWRIENDSAVFWFYFDKTPLPARKRHAGPPVKLREFAEAFRKKWKSAKTENGRLFVEIKRKYTKPEQLLKDFARKDKTLKFRVY